MTYLLALVLTLSFLAVLAIMSSGHKPAYRQDLGADAQTRRVHPAGHYKKRY